MSRKLKIHRWQHRAGSSPATGTRTPQKGAALLGSSLLQAGGLEPIAVEPASGRFRPPVRTLGATAIFAEGKNAYRARPPAPRRSKVRFAPTSFYAHGKKDVIRPLPCSSFPNRTHFVGLRFGTGCKSGSFGIYTVSIFQIKAQTLIQKHPSILEGCFCVYARNPSIHAGSGLFLFWGYGGYGYELYNRNPAI